MKSGKLFLLVLVAFLGLVMAVAASILHNGLSARATPTAMEIMMARNVRHLAIPAAARATPNPVPASPENLRDARMHFSDHCATCHANDGSGDTMIGKGLYPKPPDLRLPETQKLSDGELFWIIENGVRFTGMPAFGGSPGSQDDSWKLVDFIRHLPQLSASERMEMENNNPKSPDDRQEEQEENNFLKGGPMPEQPAAEHHHH